MLRLFSFTCLLVICAAINSLKAQSGCTDPHALNYNAAATSNDGSCIYAPATLALNNGKNLPVILNESSGVEYTSGGLWTFNDSGNPADLYRISESDATILQTVHITNATNVDWEDITADDTYFYIGDFGNNANGNRTDLKIYRVRKADISAAAEVNVTAEVINFSYQDQIIQNPVTNGPNHTAFDCEALFIQNNVLHLFTKNWLTGFTKHYTLDASPGTHIAMPVEEYDVKGLITAADISSDNTIALLGYDTSLANVFMWELNDYNSGKFFNGNKRRLDLGKTIDITNRSNDRGQTEGLCFTHNDSGYITSEKINRTVFGVPFIVPARLYSFALSGDLVLADESVYFKAIYQQPNVLLSWQIIAPEKTTYFKIERSADGSNFTEIGRQSAATASTNFTFTDSKPLPGKNYYRLQKTDENGSVKTYNVLLVNAASAAVKPTIKIASSQNILLIDCGASFTYPTAYYITTNTGIFVQKGTINQQAQSIGITGLAAGIYFIKIGSGKAIKFQKL